MENFTDADTCIGARLRFLDDLDHSQAGLILDVGHDRNREGENPMAMPGGPARILEMCKRHLCFIHLHGFSKAAYVEGGVEYKGGFGHFPPLERGDLILWVELFRALRNVGYTGPFNFEPGGEHVHPGSLKATADFPERLVALARQPEQLSP